MEPYHSLLRRQLKKHLGLESIPNELDDFIKAVNDAYQQSDADRGMLEHSLELSSNELIQANAEQKAVLQSFPDLFITIDYSGKILNSRGGLKDAYHLPPEKLIGRHIDETPMSIISESFYKAAKSIRETKFPEQLDYCLLVDGNKMCYEMRLLPLSADQILMIVRNITKRVEAEEERDELIKNLRKALEEIKTLSGLLPICSSCMKIRDDRGLWNRLEKYIITHTEAEFSHSICPDCAKKLYPDLVDQDGNIKS